MYQRFRKFYNSMLEYIVIFLMMVLTLIVVVAVIYRKAGASLSWYDEVASVLLAWLTYYGAALAALSGSHIGFNGLLNAMHPKLRIWFVIIGEMFIFGFFILLAVVALNVLAILKGDYLTSLTWVPTRLTQSVMPIGAILFIISEAMRLPDVWRQARSLHGISGHEDVVLPEAAENSKRDGEVNR